MGSSTGNMLVDNRETLEKLFELCPTLIATHCEDEATVKANQEEAKSRYGNNIPPSAHAWIRSREACIISSSLAIELAKKYNTRLHILHITTKEEIKLFDSGPIEKKRITSEACVHHMYYSDQDYIELGNLIKCNQSIKTAEGSLSNSARCLCNESILASSATQRGQRNLNLSQAPSGLPIQHSQ
jgi:dihydroorotase